MQVEVAFRAEQFLHQGVGRGAQHAVAGLDQRVPDRAQRVALADARQAERQHVRRRLEERPGGQRLQLLRDRGGEPAGVERRERLARRQPRGATQPRDPALAARFGFRLEHLDQHRHRLGVARLRQPRHELLGRRRQPELRQQRQSPACSAPSSDQTSGSRCRGGLDATEAVAPVGPRPPHAAAQSPRYPIIASPPFDVRSGGPIISLRATGNTKTSRNCSPWVREP